MTSLFMNAMQSRDSRTENNAVTHSTSGNECLNLFYMIGAMRGNNSSASLFSIAFDENPEIATRILLWARDVRGGAGERGTFRLIFNELCKSHPEIARAIMTKIPELGRYDDLIAAFDTELEGDAISLWMNAIVNERCSLAAKWFPRENSKNGFVFNKTMQSINITAKNLRKIIAKISNTVEQKMCANEWDSIEFGKVPSVAAARYQKAFGRNSPVSYEKYVSDLKEGTDKINANAVYPYDIVRSLYEGNSDVANEQWKALPNYMEGSNERIIPVVDVSGSMGCPASGSITCKDVATSLGIYVAERNEGIFKNQFITFSSDPHFHTLVGCDLETKLRNMNRAGEDMSTNISKCFDVLLHRAIKSKIPEEQMPTKLLIMSDMEFDVAQSSGGYFSRGYENTNFDEIKLMYERAGYTMPQLVFWNLSERSGKNIPVKLGESGTALVSGLSPSILKSLLNGELDPIKVMMDTISNERYNF